MLTMLITTSAASLLHVKTETSNLSNHLVKVYHMHCREMQFSPVDLLLPQVCYVCLAAWSLHMELTKLYEYGLMIKSRIKQLIVIMVCS